MHMQADIIQANVTRPACVETTATGAAYLAGLAVGYWSTKEELLDNVSVGKVFWPKISVEEQRRKIKNWRKAVATTRGWDRD